MLIPKRVKYRRQHRPTRSGLSKGGNRINFGEYAIQALELHTSPTVRLRLLVLPSTATSSVVARYGSPSTQTVL